MTTEEVLTTRQQFLPALAAGRALDQMREAQPAAGKLLIVAAHPDDEYAFAASTYRLVRERGWTADQVVLTDGESGYRYSALAEVFYGVSLAPTAEGRARLTRIRKNEVRNAGRILGIRRHYFLDQRDLGFDSDAATARTANWDRAHVRQFLEGLVAREQYDVVFILLPTAETHGHHRAAALLTLEVLSGLPQLPSRRPLIFGVEPRGDAAPPLEFAGLASEPSTRTVDARPAAVFDRETAFGYHESLNYQIVVNWVIAEHKSQGLFQTDSGRHRFEEFWLFAASGEDALRRLGEFERLLDGSQARTQAAAH